MPEHSVYAGTKGAIIAQTRTLGVELAHKGIRVNAIAPGWVTVDNYFRAIPGFSEEGAREAAKNSVPVARAGTPLDIARLAAFLCCGRRGVHHRADDHRRWRHHGVDVTDFRFPKRIGKSLRDRVRTWNLIAWWALAGRISMEALWGVLVVAAGGLIMGSGAWPFKLMKKFQFEHWWFVGMLVGLVIMPWTITLVGCPHALQSLRNVPLTAILLGNLFAVGWGIANVLCGLCYVRIGVALTGAILAGLGVSVGAITPMIFKGSGLFQNAPDLTSQCRVDRLPGSRPDAGRRGVRLAGRLRPRPRIEEAQRQIGWIPGRSDHDGGRRHSVFLHGLRVCLQPGSDRCQSQCGRTGHDDFHPGGRAQGAVGQVCRGGRWDRSLGAIWGKSPWAGPVPGKLVNDSRSTSGTCSGNPMLASWCRPEVFPQRSACSRSD